MVPASVKAMIPVVLSSGSSTSARAAVAATAAQHPVTRPRIGLGRGSNTDFILALDRGKFKSVVGACERYSGEGRFSTIDTTRSELHKLVARYRTGAVNAARGSPASAGHRSWH